MKKENKLDTNHIENESIELDSTDIGTFLGKIARKLVKEGTSLEALADKWFDEGNNQNTIRQFGIDTGVLGEQLLALRNQICQECLLKPVKILINFKSHNEKADTK